MKKWLAICLLLILTLPLAAAAEELTFSFIGDCSIGETYQRKGEKDGYTWMLDQNGMDWPFSLLREYL